MNTEPIVIREDRGDARWLTLNRPQKRNALSDELIAELKAALREADQDENVKVVAICGAGQDFCSGADLAALEKMSGASVMEHLIDVDALADLFIMLRELRKPVIAVVHGRALAGGCGLATACDLIIASESAKFGYTETRIGFVPAMVMAILRRNVSEKRAFELVVRGEVIGADDAARIGLINQVYADGNFEQRSRGYVSEVAAQSTSAVQLCKRLLYHQDGMSFAGALRAGADMNVLARMTEDAKAGIEEFLSKQKGRG